MILWRVPISRRLIAIIADVLPNPVGDAASAAASVVFDVIVIAGEVIIRLILDAASLCAANTLILLRLQEVQAFPSVATATIDCPEGNVERG